MISKKIIKLMFLTCFLPFLLISCGTGVDARKFPPNPELRVKKNMEEGRGFRLNNALKKTSSTNYEFSSSNELWRASLDTIDFMPLASVNYSGGIIVTDWYNNNQNLNDTEYEKLGHYFILDKSDLKFTSKIAELILNLHKNTNNIRKFFKYSSLKLNDLKKNFEKNILQKLKWIILLKLKSKKIL